LLGICPYDFQNLRASCATDWVERYPSHVVAKWLGHSPKVAAQHYLMSRDHHFEDVVKGTPSVPPVIAAEGPNGVTACDANCDAIATRIATPQASAPDSTESHETTEPAATIQVAAGSSKRAPVTETGPRQDAAQKKPAGAMDGPAGVKWRGQEPNKRRFIRESRRSSPSATQNATHFRLIGSTCSPAL
jgi:hypothetical protein